MQKLSSISRALFLNFLLWKSFQIKGSLEFFYVSLYFFQFILRQRLLKIHQNVRYLIHFFTFTRGFKSKKSSLEVFALLFQLNVRQRLLKSHQNVIYQIHFLLLNVVLIPKTKDRKFLMKNSRKYYSNTNNKQES